MTGINLLHAAANWAYHNHDALGSLRQLTDADGTVTLTKSYLPYGDELSSSGVGASSYGFTGEWQDMATGLVYLRARYYAPWDGRFLTQDPWSGDYNQPMSYNPWLYAYANPVMMTDPSGYHPAENLLVIFTQGADYTGPFNREGTRNGNDKGKNRRTYYAPEWAQDEKNTIAVAMWDIAEAYSRTYNSKMDEILRRENCYQFFLFLPANLNPVSAFRAIHGGPVTIERRAENATQYYKGIATYWGEKRSAGLIYVFQNVSSDTIVAHPRFIAHEMGHAFEEAVADNNIIKPRWRLPVDLLAREIDGTDYGGFYDGFLEWQYSEEDGADWRGEIFADMFIGWVYDRWENDAVGIGQQRANFMNRNMPKLIWNIIARKYGGL